MTSYTLDQIKYETPGGEYWVLDVGKRGYEVYKAGATHSTRVASIGHGAGPGLGLERATAEADRRLAHDRATTQIAGRAAVPSSLSPDSERADTMTTLTAAEEKGLAELFADPDSVEVHGSDQAWARSVVTSLKIGAGLIEAPKPAEPPAPTAGERLRDALLNGGSGAEVDQAHAAPTAQR